jgi:signal transduction histidine kinase
VRQSIDVNNHILLPTQKRLERYKSKNIKFVPQIELKGEITAPRREFTRALVHLVDNAFKFGPDNGQVKLVVESTEDGSAMITVQDYGPGIPHEFREKVFERYYQINQGDSRKYDGLGVGLTIARAVFSNSGGTVSILDDEAGCVIKATIPAVTSEDIFYG